MAKYIAKKFGIGGDADGQKDSWGLHRCLRVYQGDGSGDQEAGDEKEVCSGQGSGE